VYRIEKEIIVSIIIEVSLEKSVNPAIDDVCINFFNVLNLLRTFNLNEKERKKKFWMKCNF